MAELLRVTVVGAGAMGAFYGAKLSQAGEDVILLDIAQDHIDAINRDGLELTAPDGDVHHRSLIARNAADGGFRRADLVILFVDTNALQSALPTISDLLHEDGCVLTLQNGVGNVEALSAALGADRVIAGTSMNSCELLGPGRVRHVIHGATVLGEVGGTEISDRVQRIGNALAPNDDKIEMVADIAPHIWSKLAINCAVNPICALTGLLPGQLQMVDEVKDLQAAVAAEIETLAGALGVTLPENDLIGSIWAKSRGGMNKPSMVQHLERGRKTEIDALNGAVARMGGESGVETPVNCTITALIKGLEIRIPRD